MANYLEDYLVSDLGLSDPKAIAVSLSSPSVRLFRLSPDQQGNYYSSFPDDDSDIKRTKQWRSSD